MKKIYPTLAIIFFTSLYSFAQTPDWLWAKSADGTGNENAYSVAVDAWGNTYLTGIFQSATITFGTTTLTNDTTNNTNDIFLVKFDANGNVLWAKSAGGISNDYAYSVAVDTLGNIFLAGYFQSSSIIFGSTTLTNAGIANHDVFLVKYDSIGNVLWAQRTGGTSSDEARFVTVDFAGNIYVTGNFRSTTITFGFTTLIKDTTNNTSDIFLVKYNSNGNVLWAKSAGGQNNDNAYSIAVDNSGNVLIAGVFSSSTINFSSTTLNNVLTCYNNMFITKYDASGNVLWAKNAGGIGALNSIAVNNSGNIYIVGAFGNTTLTFGSTTLTNTDTNATADIFIAKYDANGNALWAKSAGGMNNDEAYSVAVDTLGNIFLAGNFQSSSIIFGSTTLTTLGGTDLFLVKYDLNGNSIWAKSMGGTNADLLRSVALDVSDNIYIAGHFMSSNITFGSTILNNVGSYDVFLSKLASFICSVSVNAGTDTFVCSGSGTILNSSVSGGVSPYTYLWSSGQITSSITVSPTVTTTYILTVTDSNSCSNNDTVVVTVNSNSTPTITPGGATTFCQGGSVTLTSSAGNSYLWSNGATSQSINATTAGIYTVTVTYANGCTNSSPPTTVTVNPNPDATINASGPFCTSDAALNLTSATTGGTWSGTGITNSSAGTFNPATSGVGTHTITYSVTSGGCTGTDTETITVNPSADATINPAGPFCVNDAPMNLTAVQGGGLWSGIGIVNINTGTFDPSLVSGTTMVTYTISGSCSDTDTVLIVVNPQLDATITTSTGPYCTNDSPVPLTAVNGGGTFSGTGVTGNTFYPSSLPVGTYTITYIISGSCGDTGIINMQVQSCASSISGTIFNSDYSSQVTSGKVFLINYDTSAVQLSTADIFVLNGINGNYIFTNISPGDYLIFVRPDTNNYPNAIPTYFGDTAYWYFASVLNLTSDTAGINIGVREMAALAGNGFISGFIQYGIGTGKTGNGTVIPFGDPVPGIDISLEQIPGGIKVHTNTDQNGIYSFSNLEMNSTYKLLVDIPGLPMDSSYTLTTSSSDSVFTGLDFVVDTTSGSAGIYVGSPLSAKELTVQNSGFRIYPNPNDGKFTLQITNDEITNNEVKIYNVLGEMVYKSSITNPFVIDFSNQPNGIYLVQVKSGNKIYNQKLKKQ